MSYLMPHSRAFPKYSLAQLLMLTWLVGLWCAIWFHPSGKARRLFSPPASNWSVEFAERLPRIVISDCNRVRVFDFVTGEKLFEQSITPVRGASMRKRWWSWPVAWNGDVDETFPGVAPNFWPSHFGDGRSFVLKAGDFTGQYMVAYIIDIDTGECLEWRGKNTPANLGDSWSSGKDIGVRVGDGSVLGRDIHDLLRNNRNSQVQEERLTGSYVNTWKPEISEWFVKRIRYGEMEPQTTDIGDTKQGQWVFASDFICDKDWLGLYKHGLQSRQPFHWPFDSLEVIERAEHSGDPPLVICYRYRSFPNRLGVDTSTIGWRLDSGQITVAPADAQEVRSCGDRLFVHDFDDSLYWIDCASGVRTYLVPPPRANWFRTLHFGLWIVAWAAIVRPKGDDDHTRRFGYLLFGTTILALLPPSLARFDLGELRAEQHWLLAFACLTSLFVGFIVAAWRRSVSAPVLLVVALALALFGTSWVFWSGEKRYGRTETLAAEAISTLSADFESQIAEPFRRWPIGSPKSQHRGSLEFRDRIFTADSQ